jgi:hypothetical protein
MMPDNISVQLPETIGLDPDKDVDTSPSPPSTPAKRCRRRGRWTVQHESCIEENEV